MRGEPKNSTGRTRGRGPPRNGGGEREGEGGGDDARTRRKKESAERDRRTVGLRRASTTRLATLDGRGGLDGELVRVGRGGRDGGGGGGGGGGPPPRVSSDPSERGTDVASEGSWSFW